jgi:hypothetical protein
MSKSAKPQHRNRVDASLSGSERQRPLRTTSKSAPRLAAVNAEHRQDLGSA